MSDARSRSTSATQAASPADGTRRRNAWLRPSLSPVGATAGVLVGALGLASAWMGLHAWFTGRDMAVVYLVFGTAAGWLFCFAAWRIVGAPRSDGPSPPDPMGQVASRWMRRLEQSRQFPAVETGGATLPDGECALLSEASTMIRRRMGPARLSGGMRVAVGRQAFYFGRNEPITRRTLRTAAPGRLILTDQAILFSGEDRSYAMALSQVRSIQPDSREAIILSPQGRTLPAIFLVANPILWSLIVRMAVQVPLTDGQVPERVNFDQGAASAARAA